MRGIVSPTSATSAHVAMPDAGLPEHAPPRSEPRTLVSVANSAVRAGRTGLGAPRPVSAPLVVRHVLRAGYQVHNGRPSSDAITA